MDSSLNTTNLLLGIMAAVSVLEALALIGAGVAGWVAYRRVQELVDRLEQRRIAPLLARVDAILADVKDVTATVRDETDRVDSAIRTTVDRVDETAMRVRLSVRARAHRVVSVVRGVRAALTAVLGLRSRPPARAAGRP